MADGRVVAISEAGRAGCQIQTRRHHRLSALIEKGALIRLAIIGVVILLVVGCFAFVGGWLSPCRLTQARMIDGFEQVNGYPGFRRKHAKGVCIAGHFDSNGQGMRLSKATVFQPGQVPVIGRFSLPGGQPYMPDVPTAVRSMALSFRTPNGEEWRVAMVSIPVFVVKDRGILRAIARLAARPRDWKARPRENEGFCRPPPRNRPGVADRPGQPVLLRLRQCRLQQPPCVPFRKRRRCRDTRSLVDGGSRPIRTGAACPVCGAGQELSLRRRDRAHRTGTGGMASGRDYRSTGRSDRRRNNLMAEQIESISTPGPCRSITSRAKRRVTAVMSISTRWYCPRG